MVQDSFPDCGSDGEEPDGSKPLPAGNEPEDDGQGPEQGLFVCLPAEELNLSGFSQDGRADTMAPGALLATLLDAITGEGGSGLEGLADDQLIGIISAARRMESRAAWTLLAGLPLPHFVLNAGIRVQADGIALAYTGDTGPDPVLGELGRDADLFIVEATDRDGEARRPARNLMTSAEAGQWARRAGARRLMLTHFWPGNDRAASVAAASAEFAGDVLAAEEDLIVGLEVLARRPRCIRSGHEARRRAGPACDAGGSGVLVVRLELVGTPRSTRPAVRGLTPWIPPRLAGGEQAAGLLRAPAAAGVGMHGDHVAEDGGDDPPRRLDRVL